MTADKGILIKNIYYMLTYAFHVLRQSNFDEIAAEEFENLPDMFAAIIGRGIAQQLKQGLYREYVGKSEDLATLRGKLNMQNTIKNRMQQKQLLSCDFDELSENNLLNRILKTTMLILIKQASVKAERKSVLKKNLLYFSDVEYVEPTNIRWNQIRYQRNNQGYKMLLNICRLILESMILTTEKGEIKMATFLDDQEMSHLYEKFILEYYRYHHPEFHANPDQIAWNLDDDNDMWLPSMISDITLKYKGKTFIIDAKYYGKQMQSNYEVDKFRNAHLYQLFAYVKNKDTEHDGSVSGMLLYAKTSEKFQPKNSFMMDGNRLSINSLNLDMPFEEIRKQLEEIVRGELPENL